jgi:hypothetical protein
MDDLNRKVESGQTIPNSQRCRVPHESKGNDYNGHHFCILTVNNLRKLSGKCAAMAAMRASRDTTSTLLCVFLP